MNRLLSPGSEFHLHREWFVNSAMDELLAADLAVADKDRQYRCLDRILEHKRDLFVWLRPKWADLFQADFEVPLYDLTSTYFEGEMEQNPKARRGYSRGDRTVCRIPSEAILKKMREAEAPTYYLVGTPKGKIPQHEKEWLQLPWQKVRDSVEVKLYPHEVRYSYWPRVRAGGLKEIAIRRNRLTEFTAHYQSGRTRERQRPAVSNTLPDSAPRATGGL